MGPSSKERVNFYFTHCKKKKHLQHEKMRKNEKMKKEKIKNEKRKRKWKNKKLTKTGLQITLDTTIVIILNYYITSSSYDLIEKEKVKTYKIQYQNNVRVGGIGIQYCIHPPKSRNSSAACAPVKR